MNTSKSSQSIPLDLSVQKKKGQLTLFLGAVPGIGKTYAMLKRAHKLKGQGRHVVVGVVETYGRDEIEELLTGLTIIPRKQVTYWGRIFEEMDLDAILQRNPEIVFIDELAHNNVILERHEYRWQDVNELLDAGIDVYSTLNIYDLESLNDLIYQIIELKIYETVPNDIFEYLKEICLIDLPNSELQERLDQGKIYKNKQLIEDKKIFFKPENLAAMRELAMQTVAEQVDSGLKGKYSLSANRVKFAKNHFMLPVYQLIKAEELIRRASRIAQRSNASLSVVFFIQKTKQSSDQMLLMTKAFNLARKLRANAYLIYNDYNASSILQAAYDYNASNIVLLSNTNKFKWSAIFLEQVAHDLLKIAHPFEITFIQPAKNQFIDRSYKEKFFFNKKSRPKVVELIESSAIISVGVLLAVISSRYLDIGELSLIFIMVILLIAIRTRLLVTIYCVVVCFFLYNFIFIEPRYTLQIESNHGFFALFTFLITAWLVGRLASRLRLQILSLRTMNSISIQLQELGRELSSCVNIDQILQTAKQHLEKALQAEVWVRIGQHSTSVYSSFSDSDLIVANWTQKHIKPSGRFTNSFSGSEWWFNPLILEHDSGVVAIRFISKQQKLDSELQHLAERMMIDISQAAMRVHLSIQLEDARVVTEAEKLRSALLSSVSHDLRSPLAVIIGSADSLQHYNDKISVDEQKILLKTIHQEGVRLNQYIQNLLDMTRLGHHKVKLVCDWIGIDELIGSVKQRILRYHPSAKIEVSLQDPALQLYVHPALIEQAIFNVLDNAVKFSPEQALILIQTELKESFINIDILDQGVGIPENERIQVFDMFYTMQRGDRGKTGTGLGLNIVKAIVSAHKGEVQAFARDQQQGTLIRISLPIHSHIDE
ncbi:sensor histidine kinase KdpD [Acinetobacter baumannii]|uniref:ATP-binding protein n=2 Tax=Acinetobacter baumannii TaxID=470 RepID=UPI0002D60470|nr:ATP-binding protein [Acinetobacter baumannii]TPU56991.1 sensor histidine kinase KdpD [Acinetobacter baumannii]